MIFLKEVLWDTYIRASSKNLKFSEGYSLKSSHVCVSEICNFLRTVPKSAISIDIPRVRKQKKLKKLPFFLQKYSVISLLNCRKSDPWKYRWPLVNWSRLRWNRYGTNRFSHSSSFWFKGATLCSFMYLSKINATFHFEKKLGAVVYLKWRCQWVLSIVIVAKHNWL